MKQVDLYDRLVNSTIQVIAEYGFNGATTRNISDTACMNEAYIYRCFKDKEDLYAQTFKVLDEELSDEVLRQVSVLEAPTEDKERQFKSFASGLYGFFLGNRSKCLAYVRYYHSPFFKKYSLESHREIHRPIAERFGKAMKHGADAAILLNYILDALLDFAVKVFNGERENGADDTERIYNLLYASVSDSF